MKIIFLLIFLFPLSMGWAKSKLPELLTKQNINLIRFLSSDGRYTYYQRLNGDFLLATNFAVKTILKGDKGTNYLAKVGSAQRKIIIAQDALYEDFASLRGKSKIFVALYGETQIVGLGEGVAPQLHLNDDWASYFDPLKKTIYLQHTQNTALIYRIKLGNIANSFFSPNILMMEANIVLYTTLNKKGIPEIVRHNYILGQGQTVMSGTTPEQQIDLCSHENQVYFMIRGIGENNSGTSIYRFRDEKLDQFEAIYQSKKNDLGPLICQLEKEALYFIQNQSDAKVGTVYEVVKSTIVDNKITSSTTLTDLKGVSQLVLMDKLLLVPHNGSYYVVRGNPQMNKDILPDSKTKQIPKLPTVIGHGAEEDN